MQCSALQKKFFLLFAQTRDNTSLLFTLPTELLCIIYEFFSRLCDLSRSIPLGFFLKSGTERTNNFLKYPGGIAWNKTKGRLIVGDNSNRIGIFSSLGTFSHVFGKTGKGDGEFLHPAGISVSERTQIMYICDTPNHRLQLFDSDGVYLSQAVLPLTKKSTPSSPAHIFISQDEKIYITDTSNRSVHIFSNGGEDLITSFGNSDGINVGDPRGIIMSSDSNLFVCDWGGHQIRVFNESGKFLFAFGGEGRQDGKFYGPDGITIDQDDNIYVADSWNHRIQIFDSAGKFLMKIGSRGSAPGQLSHPADVVVNELGDLFVSDTWNHGIQVWG